MKAPREVVPILMEMIRFNSVLDVGCGTGTWLKVFSENGITDFLGVDQDHQNRSLLIPPANFKVIDLHQPFDVGRKFDLIVALEVAEHLHEISADTFIDSLLRHGDTILFSAAIPGQGGQNHLNEQWPEYWQQKFRQRGFFLNDFLRRKIWNNQNIEWWYRQNILLVTKSKPDEDQMISVVHPELFNQVIQNNTLSEKSLIEGRHGVRISLKILVNALRFKLKSIF
ncbi:MAG: class I SAM-dependent methyltransferase [Flammeovirgaceae bacterium]|nr:class I SAM-dependent methyltransferase [Flammeovirgaceae bacterium]